MFGVANACDHNCHRKNDNTTKLNSIPHHYSSAVKQVARPTIPPQFIVDTIITEKIDYPKVLNSMQNLIFGSLNNQHFKKYGKYQNLYHQRW